MIKMVVMKGQNDGAKLFNGSLKILSQNVGTNGYKFNNGITIFEATSCGLDAFAFDKI